MKKFLTALTVLGLAALPAAAQSYSYQSSTFRQTTTNYQAPQQVLLDPTVCPVSGAPVLVNDPRIVVHDNVRYFPVNNVYLPHRVVGRNLVVIRGAAPLHVVFPAHPVLRGIARAATFPARAAFAGARVAGRAVFGPRNAVVVNAPGVRVAVRR